MADSLWKRLKKNIETAQREKKKAVDKLALARKKYSEKKALEAHKREQAVHAESMRVWKEAEKRSIKIAQEQAEREQKKRDVILKAIGGYGKLEYDEPSSGWSRTAKKGYRGDVWGEFTQSYRDNVSKGRVPVARYKCSFCGAISDYPGCNNCKPTLEQRRKRRMIQIFTAGGEVNTKPYR